MGPRPDTRAREELGRQPKVSFDELVRMMVEYDYERERRKMIQVEESKLFNKTWHHIADGDPAAQADPQTAPARDAHATAPNAHHTTDDTHHSEHEQA